MSSWLRPTSLLLASSVSLSLFLSFWRQAKHFNIVHHRLDFSWGLWLSLFLLSVIILSCLWFIFSLIIRGLTRFNLWSILKNNYLSFLPFIFLSLAPLTLQNYVTKQDIYSRLKLGLLLVVLAFLLIEFLFIKSLLNFPLEKKEFFRLFLALSPRKKCLLLFFIAYFSFGLGAYLINSRGADFSGDEPHYLIIAHSLIVDHDFDLSNNYEQRDYWRFLKSKAILQPHTVPGARPTNRLSFHSPGVAFLLLPFYWLGQILGGWALALLPRLAMAIFGSLFCLQLYWLIKEMGWGEKIALKLWSISLLTAPIYFYSFHLYPEIIVAFLSLLIFRWLIQWERLKNYHFLLIGLLLSSFFWFHAIKYFFILLPLGLYALIRIHNFQKKFKNFLFIGLPFLAGFAGYFYFQKVLYGSINPTSVSWQGAMGPQESLAFLKFIFSSIPFRFRWETLAGYFFDQRDGLFLYAPIYVLAFVGLIAMLRQKTKFALKILLLTWPYFLFSAFLTQRAGYAPQARPLVASFWGFLLFLGYFFWTNQKRWLNFMAQLFFIYSLIINGLLLLSPLNLYQETTAGTTERAGGLFWQLSHLHFSLPQILPSFLKIENSFWLPNYVWLSLFFGFLVLSQLKWDCHRPLKFPLKISFTLFNLLLFLLWFTYYPRLILTNPVKKKWPENQVITFYSLSRVAQLEKPGTFFLPQANRPYHFWWKTNRQLESIEIEASSPAADIPVEIFIFDYPFFKGNINQSKKKLILAFPPTYKWRKDYLYWLRIDLGPESENRLSAKPFQFSFSLR
ncbi:MAG: hypothetical protein N3B16_11080 [Candidatus Aminicenantes bacterium]|nr:hypothetical protein [Candidatus Aminicenantes bacterium]